MKDTFQETEKIQIELLRKMPLEKKWKVIFKFIEVQKELIIEGIRKRHPEYSDKEVYYAFKRIILGKELFEKVYPEAKYIKP